MVAQKLLIDLEGYPDPDGNLFLAIISLKKGHKKYNSLKQIFYHIPRKQPIYNTEKIALL